MGISRDDIINELKNEILTLKLTPGTIVSEATLTSRYGISRTPIRDILKQLSQEGYINIYPQRGSKVSLIDLKSVEQIIFLRSTLEKEIIKDICGKLTDPQKEELTEILSSQESALSGENAFEEFMILDDKFHNSLFVISDHIYLWELIQRLNVHYMRYRKLHMLKQDKLKTLLEQHKMLLKAIVSNDSSVIEELINKHIRDDVNSNYFLENYPDYIELAPTNV